MKNEKLANSTEFPFSNVHVEDSIFLVNASDENHEPAIFALECVFYMSDCHYMAMNPQNYAGTNIPSNVNRMGTENYKVADYEDNTETSVFKDAPINLIANRKESYTHENRKNLMKT